jgi:hypothetical protein
MYYEGFIPIKDEDVDMSWVPDIFDKNVLYHEKDRIWITAYFDVQGNIVHSITPFIAKDALLIKVRDMVPTLVFLRVPRGSMYDRNQSIDVLKTVPYFVSKKFNIFDAEGLLINKDFEQSLQASKLCDSFSEYTGAIRLLVDNV